MIEKKARTTKRIIKGQWVEKFEEQKKKEKYEMRNEQWG